MLGLLQSSDRDELSDEVVLRRSQSEPWLFGELLTRYQAPFTRKVERIVRDPRDVEEIVQDTFVKIYQNAHRYEPQPGAQFSSWAYRILLNTAYTYYQRQRKASERVQLLEPEILELVGEIEDAEAVRELRDGIERILIRLPDHFAEVLRLHYLERWPQQDIAERTGETVGTVKTRIFRAKAAFRQHCGGEEVELLL